MSFIEAIQREGETEDEARARRKKMLLDGWKFSCNCPKCAVSSEDVEFKDEARFEDRYNHHIEAGLYSV